MAEFQSVDRIVFHYGSDSIVFVSGDYDFDIIKYKLYPFQAGRVGISSGVRRNLQRLSDGRIAEITYFVSDNRLFAVGIYAFAELPFSDHEDVFIRNTFRIDDGYGVIFINDGNFMGRFALDSFDEIAIISRYSQ